MSCWSFVMDVLSAFDAKFEVQLVKLPCPIASLPPRYFLHYVQVPVKHSSLPFCGRTYTNSETCWPNYHLLFFHSPDDSTVQHAETLSYWQHDQLWERSSSHIPTASDLAISTLLALAVNVELESIFNPIFSSKVQGLNQPLLYFNLSQMLFRCFEFDMAGLLNFYSYLFLSACAWTWWNINEHTEYRLLTRPCLKPWRMTLWIRITKHDWACYHGKIITVTTP